MRIHKKIKEIHGNSCKVMEIHKKIIKMSKNCARSEPKGAKGCQKGAIGCQKVAQWEPKGNVQHARALPEATCNMPGRSQGARRGNVQHARGHQMAALGCPWEALVGSGRPSGTKSKNNKKTSLFWRPKWMTFGSHFLTFWHLVFR